MTDRKTLEREENSLDCSLDDAAASPHEPLDELAPGRDDPVEPRRAGWLRWPAALLGRVVQWVCPTGAEARKDCCSDRCRFWTLCKCAQEEFRSHGALEDRTWWLLAACGGAAILYWLLGT